MASTPVVFVTGAAGGVGFAIVRALLEERNASVIASDIVKGDLEQLQASHSNKLEVVVGDITKVGQANFCKVLIHRLTLLSRKARPSKPYPRQ